MSAETPPLFGRPWAPHRRVVRGTTVNPWLCPVHGSQQPDVLGVDNELLCLHCAGEASGYQPWFYTSSPFADQILALNSTRLVPMACGAGHRNPADRPDRPGSALLSRED